MPKASVALIGILCPDSWEDRARIEGWFANAVGTLGLPVQARSIAYPPTGLAQTIDSAGFVPATWCVLCLASEREAVARSLSGQSTPAEIWDLDPKGDRGGCIEAEIHAWVARRITGQPRTGPATPRGQEKVAASPTGSLAKSTPAHPGSGAGKKGPIISLGRETKGRGGKGVTLLFDLPLSTQQAHDLCVTLKNKCGTGGTVKDGRIEIQGDQRERIAQLLEGMGYRVKRVGG